MKSRKCFKKRLWKTVIQKVLPILSLVLLSTACGTATKAPYEGERLLKPPSDLLVLCSVEPPPNKEAFLKLSVNERLALLGRLYMKQTKNVSACNVRLIDLNK